MQFLRTDSFYTGAVLGLVMPLLAFALTRWTDWAMLIGNKPLSLYVIAALLNLLLLRYFYRRGNEHSARGVIMVTFLGALLLIFCQGLRV